MQTELGLFRQYRHNKEEGEGDRGGFRVVKEGGIIAPPPTKRYIPDILFVF